MALQAVAKRSIVELAMAAERLWRGAPACTPADLAGFRSFLFLQYMMPLGYCVHDTPIYQALRACRPEAKIRVATRGTGYETLRHNPYIDALIVTADPFRELRRAANELKAGLRQTGAPPECGITNCSNPRTRNTLLNMLAGRHVRLGHTLAPALYHLPQTYDRSASLIDNNLRLVRNFGCADGHYEPRVFFSRADLERVQSLLQASGAGTPLVVFVTQNSGGQRTGWHDERFVQVIRHVHEKRRCEIVFVGTAGDGSAIDALRSKAATAGKLPGISLAGQTTISELSALLSSSDFVVSLDTGTMHMGRAAAVPMVVLGPSWQKPLEWLPLGNPRVLILRGDDIEQAPENYKLDEIDAEPVMAAFDELLALYPPAERERSARVQASLSSVDHGAAVLKVEARS